MSGSRVSSTLPGVVCFNFHTFSLLILHWTGTWAVNRDATASAVSGGGTPLHLVHPRDTPHNNHQGPHVGKRQGHGNHCLPRKSWCLAQQIQQVWHPPCWILGCWCRSLPPPMFPVSCAAAPARMWLSNAAHLFLTAVQLEACSVLQGLREERKRVGKKEGQPERPAVVCEVRVLKSQGLGEKLRKWW